MKRQFKFERASNRRYRRGAATIDYFLVLCVTLPLAGFIWRIVPQIIHLVYDFLCVTLTWPFL